MERVSILMDGEHNADEAAREIARLKADASLREHWDTCHLIGDAMRGGLAGAPRAGFSARFSERLAQEPTVLAPRARGVTRTVQTYALRAAASVAAVAVVGWATLNVSRQEAPVQVVAAPDAPSAIKTPVPVPAPAQAQPQVAVNATEEAPDKYQDYLMAHQGISPTTAIQGVTPYIRTVSATGE